MKNQIVTLLAVLAIAAVLGTTVLSRSEFLGNSSGLQINGARQARRVPPSAHELKRRSTRFSPVPNEGYSIHGIQPGDDLQQLLDHLPPGTKAERISEEHPRPGLRFSAPGQQSVAVTTQVVGDRRVVREVWCMGPGPNFSIELNDKTVLGGTSSYEDFTTLLGAEVHGRGATTPDGRLLRVEFTSNGLFVVSLSAAE